MSGSSGEEAFVSPVYYILEMLRGNPLHDMPRGAPKAALSYYNNVSCGLRGMSPVTCEDAYSDPSSLLFGVEK